jgi:hypothetical protein
MYQTKSTGIEEFLQHVEHTADRAAGNVPFDSRTRSYLLLSMVVGFLGMMLPGFLFVVGYLAIPHEEIWWRGSLSAYYHSGLRDAFVGTLAMVGILLFTYKFTEKNLDNLFSIIAGLGAIGVASFPTGIPDGVPEQLTLLQEKFGEDRVRNVHYVATVLFLTSLFFLCREFARREGNRKQERVGQRARFPPAFWYRFHMTMAGIIALAFVFIIVTHLFNFWEGHAIFFGEAFVCWAFGWSWLLKGTELTMLPKKPM